jgi:hypothetical protein
MLMHTVCNPPNGFHQLDPFGEKVERIDQASTHSWAMLSMLNTNVNIPFLQLVDNNSSLSLLPTKPV